MIQSIVMKYRIWKMRRFLKKCREFDDYLQLYARRWDEIHSN